jgi:ABC-2 type transport system permease protein
MMTVGAAVAEPTMKRFHSPQTVIGRFVARRSLRMAGLWALAFGAVVATKAAGFATAYPTAADKAKIAASFSNNIGLNALLGRPNQIDTVHGFTTWNTLGLMVIIGSIWMFLSATRTFRGEEDNGRAELLLSGQTTARRAAVNILAGLSASLALFYVIIAAVFTLVGRLHKVDYDTSAALFYALAAVSGPALFMGVGALASQLMPTRSRAATAAAGVFGICFLIRAMADTTSAHWLLNVTPVGWIEKLQPLYGSDPIWLLPLAAATLLLAGLTVFLAGRRDLGASILPDHDTARPRLMLLGSPLGAALRLTRTTSLSWLAGISFVALFFGLLTKSAAQALTSSAAAQRATAKLTHAPQVNGTVIFLGIVFFFATILTMVFVASAVSAVREDEAEGYLDNLLVRPVGRLRWLGGRLLLVTTAIIIVGLLASLAAWIGESSQHAGEAFHPLLLAGLNLMAPAILLLGLAICVMGLLPRLTSVIGYSVIAWSFLLQIVGSGINLNHWLLDTGIFQHVSLAPAVAPNWGTDARLVIIGIVLVLIGAIAFNRRDLQTE